MTGTGIIWNPYIYSNHPTYLIYTYLFCSFFLSLKWLRMAYSVGTTWLTTGIPRRGSPPTSSISCLCGASSSPRTVMPIPHLRRRASTTLQWPETDLFSTSTHIIAHGWKAFAETTTLSRATMRNFKRQVSCLAFFMPIAVASFYVILHSDLPRPCASRLLWSQDTFGITSHSLYCKAPVLKLFHSYTTIHYHRV